MKLKAHLIKIEKTKCPEKCEFKKKEDIEIFLVPPPSEILGIIVSRDPTINWGYRCLKEDPDVNIRRKILFASAIPLSLITKIRMFKRKIDENDEKCLRDVILQKTYWTHLHKCMTDSRREPTKFKNKNATKCANHWLKVELNRAINDKTRFIIALGRDVQKWFFKPEWEENKKVPVIGLPHPSNQNNRIWYHPDTYKDGIKIEKRIDNLIKLCKGN